jgi:hypothetical protein
VGPLGPKRPLLCRNEPTTRGWASQFGQETIYSHPSLPTTTATMPSIDVTITATYADALSSEQSK